jgi:lipoyl-dependent peroxiredoxin
MPTRTARARWEGTLQEGSGTIALGSGSYEGPYSFQSRFEEGDGTNPEELIGGAHAGCFTMALNNILVQAGHQPDSVETTASVHLDKADEGFDITRIELDTKARVPGLDASELQQHAETAKAVCPVSRVLTGTEISVQAELLA